MKVSLSWTASNILCTVGTLVSKYCGKIGHLEDFVTLSSSNLQPWLNMCIFNYYFHDDKLKLKFQKDADAHAK